MHIDLINLLYDILTPCEGGSEYFILYLTATVTSSEANFKKLPLPRSFCGPPFRIAVAHDALQTFQTGDVCMYSNSMHDSALHMSPTVFNSSLPLQTNRFVYNNTAS